MVILSSFRDKEINKLFFNLNDAIVFLSGLENN
jgi:hypothetical protein